MGPSCFSVQDRHLIPALHPTLAKCTVPQVSTITQHQDYSAIIDTTLTEICEEDLTGQVPWLWNCPSATATESYIQDTQAHWKPLLQAPWGGGSRGVVLRGPRVWRGHHWGGH